MPPVTAADRVMVAAPAALRCTRIPSPAVPVPRTGPDASMETAPDPLETTLIPASLPVTDAAVIVIAPPELSSFAWIPALEVEMTVPVTLIEMAPPPWLSAKIASCGALMALPAADWVKEMPPLPPVWDREKPLPEEEETAVSEFRVTARLVAPAALRVCVCAMVFAPLQVNTPPDPVQLLVTTISARLNVLALSLNSSW